MVTATYFTTLRKAIMKPRVPHLEKPNHCKIRALYPVVKLLLGWSPGPYPINPFSREGKLGFQSIGIACAMERQLSP